ncbi:nuclear transport factor 2 family protein [Pseudoalteromonas sp. HL-AS1]|uniref:YybH family protein n=1 Tax=Pseudoalteromonas sp. HL-AS1 TaxID=3071081 RepID=UPI00281496E3|nr:nuclear transport factor 2 family protein [Pseudoalteromonas sp. HL-AS1]WMS91996.1 nuclear transport factor 2 family protein [Pseudoalteromonas sp. HL-AS1]
MLIKSFNLKILLLLIFSTVSSFTVSAHDDEKYSKKGKAFVNVDSEAAKTVSLFHASLKQGNREAARKLLADDVIIFEGGSVERSADEYAKHHMIADMKFFSAVNSELLEHQVYTNGDIAYSISRSKTQGKYKGKDIKSMGMESITLKNTDTGWKITHIHWSN